MNLQPLVLRTQGLFFCSWWQWERWERGLWPERRSELVLG